MTILTKEIIIDAFLIGLKKKLLDEVEKTPITWAIDEFKWYLKDKTVKHVWYSMIEKRSEAYREYAKEISNG